MTRPLGTQGEGGVMSFQVERLISPSSGDYPARWYRHSFVWAGGYPDRAAGVRAFELAVAYFRSCSENPCERLRLINLDDPNDCVYWPEEVEVVMEGEFITDWLDARGVLCPKCGEQKVQYRVWEDDRGGHEDEQYLCACGHSWWVDGIDA